MGVPSFYRWLCRKYPRVAVNAVEKQPTTSGNMQIPVDTTLPNPNGFEIDNLYLDMNGIIHPCCHPEHGAAPPTEEDMIARVFEYIDRIFAIARPRKILYMAIDGVAPRAKMNQQRQRRFRAAQERLESAGIESFIREDFITKGKKELLPPPKGEVWDSNVITPGTLFMAKLSEALHYYIVSRFENDPAWKDIKVVFSDARVPGEGEHKIMEFIRNQRSQDGYNPNTSHCLYGMDADLIMLALSSHEPHFYIIREVVLEATDRKCFICGKLGHTAGQCRGINNDALTSTSSNGDEYNVLPAIESYEPESDPLPPGLVPFQFLKIAVLREYLNHDLTVDVPFWNLERAIDDWILLCFFVGNDFLPHMPSLEIREGAIDLLAQIHRRVVQQCGGFLSDNGYIDPDRIAILIQAIGEVEDVILKRRGTMNKRQQQRSLNNQQNQLQFDHKKKSTFDESTNQGGANIQFVNKRHHSQITDGEAKDEESKSIDNENDIGVGMNSNTEAANEMKKKLKLSRTTKVIPAASIGIAEKMIKGDDTDDDKGDEVVTLPVPQENTASTDELNHSLTPIQKEGLTKAQILLSAGSTIKTVEEFNTFMEKLNKLKELGNDPEDKILYGEFGYRDRYYAMKLGLNRNNDKHTSSLTHIMKSYAQGLSWVFQYYFNGCPSWSWYYPYHYAPLARDLDMTDAYDLDIKKDRRIFTPFQQLLSVLPSASSHALPPSFANLMLDPNSQICDFYPEEFGLDLNGKRYNWQGVVLLPFIDENRLVRVAEKAAEDISNEETERNTLGVTYLYIHKTNSLRHAVLGLQNRGLELNIDDPVKEREMAAEGSRDCIEINAARDDLSGYLSPMYNAKSPTTPCSAPFHKKKFPTISNPSVYSLTYRLAKDLPHKSELLPDLIPPSSILGPLDFQENSRRRKDFRENTLESLATFLFRSRASMEQKIATSQLLYQVYQETNPKNKFSGKIQDLSTDGYDKQLDFHRQQAAYARTNKVFYDSYGNIIERPSIQDGVANAGRQSYPPRYGNRDDHYSNRDGRYNNNRNDQYNNRGDRYNSKNNQYNNQRQGQYQYNNNQGNQQYQQHQQHQHQHNDHQYPPTHSNNRHGGSYNHNYNQPGHYGAAPPQQNVQDPNRPFSFSPPPSNGYSASRPNNRFQ